MRWIGAFVAGWAVFAGVQGQDGKDKAPAKRHGLDVDLQTYPQATPKETLASVLQALQKKRIDYVFAQLAEPEWVDRRVKEITGGFAAVVEEGKNRLVDDPGAIKRLAKFLKDGEWKIEDDTAVVRLKDMDDQAVFFRKLGNRWFLENRKR